MHSKVKQRKRNSKIKKIINFKVKTFESNKTKTTKKPESVPSLHEADIAACVWLEPQSSSPPEAVLEYLPASGDHSDECPTLKKGRPAKI